jgi:hypothetical protein
MSILKVNTIQDKGGNTLLSSDGAGTISSGGAITNTPLFYAYITGTQSVSNASETKVQLETELFDTDNCFDSSTNYRFTPNLAGYYMLVGSLQINSASDFDGWQVNIYKNGSEISHMNGRSEYYNVHKNQIIAYANGSSDYFELYARQDSGGSLNINPGQIRSYFFGYRLVGA